MLEDKLFLPLKSVSSFSMLGISKLIDSLHQVGFEFRPDDSFKIFNLPFSNRLKRYVCFDDEDIYSDISGYILMGRRLQIGIEKCNKKLARKTKNSREMLRLWGIECSLLYEDCLKESDFIYNVGEVIIKHFI